MSETRETQAEEVVVPDGYLVLRLTATLGCIVVKHDAISFWSDTNPSQPSAGASVVVSGVGDFPVFQTMPEVARLIAVAQGGGEARSEAEKVLAWLQGATGREERAVSLSGGVCCATIYPAPGGMIRRIGATYLAAIAAAEAER